MPLKIKHQTPGTMCFLLIALISIDQTAKSLAGPSVWNRGFFLGSFGGESAFFRVFLSVFLLLVFIMIITGLQWFFQKRASKLVPALTLFEAGLIGNGIDKILFGAVRDFIPLRISEGSTLYLNGADLFEWAGLISVSVLLFQNTKTLWPVLNQRLRIFAFPEFQRRLVVKAAVGVFAFSMVTGLLGLFYLRATGQGTAPAELVICILLLSCANAALGAMAVTLWSNSVFGPLQAWKRSLDGPTPATFRKSDETALIELISKILGERIESGSHSSPPPTSD